MARSTGPSCKQCRREGTKLYLKGVSCNTEKCIFFGQNDSINASKDSIGKNKLNK